jgi:hypothetical protein
MNTFLPPEIAKSITIHVPFLLCIIIIIINVKGQAVCLTLEDGTDSSETSVTNYQSALRSVPEERQSLYQLLCYRRSKKQVVLQGIFKGKNKSYLWFLLSYHSRTNSFHKLYVFACCEFLKSPSLCVKCYLRSLALRHAYKSSAHVTGFKNTFTLFLQNSTHISAC